MRRLWAWARGLTAGAVLVTGLAVVVAGSATATTAPKGCKAGPVIVVRRGAAVVAVYSASHAGARVCARLGSRSSGTGAASSENGARVPAGAIQVFWAGMSGNPGLVVLFGRLGAGVTAVTIERSDHFAPERARVRRGWYVAMWLSAPGATHATTVKITAGPITRAYALPPADRQGVPRCGGLQPGSACAGEGPGQTVGR